MEISPPPADLAHAVEISPTMPFDGGAARPLEVSPTMPFDGAAAGRMEISPTMPFDAAPARPLEISPTMPFDGAAAARPMEISPTMPFDGAPEVRPVEISPTMPFDGAAGNAAEGRPVEISPTMPFNGAPFGEVGPAAAESGLAQALAAEEAEDFAALGLTRGAKKDKAVTEVARPMEEAAKESRQRRQAKEPERPLSEDSHSGDEAGKENVEGELNEQMSKEEREFLRHKRRKLREE